MTTLRSIALAACTGLCFAAHGAPLLLNGSLTGPIANAGVPTGWSVTTPSPDTMDATHNVGVNDGGTTFSATPSATPDGGTWVGFAREGTFIESFGQTVSGFTVGAMYSMAWYHGNFGYNLGYTGTNAISLLINGVSVGDGGALALGSAWVNESVSFVASATSLRFDFQLRDTARSYHSIDGIRLTDVVTGVPEPMSLALVGVGLLGVALTRKRKAA